MAEILKEWLTERLQVPITWEAEEFGAIMKNGHIVGRVLYSYNVINEDMLYQIRPFDAPIDVQNNWKYLTEWLREVDVYISDAELYNIMDGKGSAILRLFYQLFLHLDKRDRTNFLKRELQMVSTLVEKVENRFKVEGVKEDKKASVDYLSKPLLNDKHFIEWQRKKEAEVKETYDNLRHKYKKIINRIQESKIPCGPTTPQKPKSLTKKDKKDMERFVAKYPCYQNYTYDELLNLEAGVQKKKLSSSDCPESFMNMLTNKFEKKSVSESFQSQVRDALSRSLWDASISAEEAKVDVGLARKVMKLSQYEKQMCTQIMETKQQARNLMKNRIEAERQYTEQRDFQFHQYLDNIKEQLHLEVVEIDFEKCRQDKLHKKLYAEKIKRKRQHYYEICYEVMLALVDYATKLAYWTRLLEDSVPEHFIHEWKTLFFKRQPIFDILEPMEDILKEHVLEEELVPEEEEIIRLELDRQDALNDSDFNEYHNYIYPWILDVLVPNYDNESEERKYEYLGMRILGHVVFTLLEIKYPYPPPRPPADLPQFMAKALIRNLPDKVITIPMQVLLNRSKIHVVRLESAINFCLRKFKDEMTGCVDIDLSYDKFIASAQEEDKKEFVRTLKGDEDGRSKSSEATIAAYLGPIPPNCKLTQTPKTLPEEDLTLSTAAGLGKYAYEALSFGDSLTDHLITAMLVEYIKDQEDLKGFVIINYPNCYREAQILEETFSGIPPPDETELLEDKDDIYLEETIYKHRKKEKDPYRNVRVSRLVYNPHKKEKDKPFESYFTCYLKLQETEDILQELVVWDLTEDNSELIDRFYAALGLNYSLYYEVIDKELLAQICKYIIGDLTLPIKSYHELFGEGILSLLDFPSSDDKRTKSKMIRPDVNLSKSKEKVSRRGSKSKSTLNFEMEVVKSPETISPYETIEHTVSAECTLVETDLDIKTLSSIEEVFIMAGEEDWEYGQLPIPENIGKALATCWEEIEKAYIHDMEQMFFSKRLQINSLVPYCRFIKDKMEQIITLPSTKQDLVCRFQKDYNSFEDDWRSVHLSKNEWHCRIKELQTQLYHICDERKLFAEQQRHAIIMDNWTVEELTTMANTYISCMQAEVNRSISTFQTLHDFYFCLLKKMPPNDRLHSRDLVKITREVESDKKGGEDKVFKALKVAFQELHIKNILLDYFNNPVNMILENNVKFSIKFIKETNDYYRSIISKEYSELARLTPAPKKKDESNLSAESINLEEIFKLNALKCVDEWLMGINGEMFRLNLRLTVLHHKCLEDMKLFNDTVCKCFMAIQNNIDTYYMNEIRSVDRLCKYFQMAVEKGVKIPEMLLLEHDNFIIDPNLLQFETEQPTTNTGSISERVDALFEFKICQLARLRTQFKIVAPTGIALQQAFIYLLQDFIFFGKESCEGQLFPELFKRVDPEQIPKLVFLLFGEIAYVDWRDFLIYCLNIRFPTVEELLEARRLFRCHDRDSTELIDRDDFIGTCLWFETEFEPEDPHAQLRKNLIKHFLCELFETTENKINYSAFLLAFCKNVNPIEGFANALSMAVGKKTCYVFSECEEVVCRLIKMKQYRNECLICANKCANEFLIEVINRVVNICESTTIEEVAYTAEEPAEDTKSKKKGKKGAKKEELTTQSARQAKKVEKSKTKLTHSETDVKAQVFICPPCEVPPEPEEVPPGKEEIEEEQKSEALIDPNLVYAVSQDVIWKVLRICLPWHFALIPDRNRTPYEDRVKQVLKKLEDHTDEGDIFVSMLVLEPEICKLLHKVKKFTALNLVEEVGKVCL